MAKSPAILFYTSDFLTGTLTMTDDQVGKYIRLLCLQHQKGVLSEKDMMFICKSYDDDVFSKFVKNGVGYYNDRMKIEIEKREKYSISRSENRVKGIENKEIKKKKRVSKSYDNHMDNENENINKGVQGEKYDHLTDGGWSADLIAYDAVCKFYPKLLKLKRPLQHKEHLRLVAKWGDGLVRDIYRDMEAWAKLNTKDWAAGVADKWCKSESEKRKK